MRSNSRLGGIEHGGGNGHNVGANDYIVSVVDNNIGGIDSVDASGRDISGDAPGNDACRSDARGNNINDSDHIAGSDACSNDINRNACRLDPHQ